MVSLIGASIILLQSLPVPWGGIITASITRDSRIKVVFWVVVILRGVVSFMAVVILRGAVLLLAVVILRRVVLFSVVVILCGAVLLLAVLRGVFVLRSY